MYWVDSNEVHTSWNSKFLQHVKRQCRGAGYGVQHGGETDAAALATAIAQKTEVSATTSPTPAGLTDPTEQPDPQLIEAINQVSRCFG